MLLCQDVSVCGHITVVVICVTAMSHFRGNEMKVSRGVKEFVIITYEYHVICSEGNGAWKVDFKV